MTFPTFFPPEIKNQCQLQMLATMHGCVKKREKKDTFDGFKSHFRTSSYHFPQVFCRRTPVRSGSLVLPPFHRSTLLALRSSFVSFVISHFFSCYKLNYNFLSREWSESKRVWYGMVWKKAMRIKMVLGWTDFARASCLVLARKVDPVKDQQHPTSPAPNELRSITCCSTWTSYWGEEEEEKKRWKELFQ